MGVTNIKTNQIEFFIFEVDKTTCKNQETKKIIKEMKQ